MSEREVRGCRRIIARIIGGIILGFGLIVLIFSALTFSGFAGVVAGIVISILGIAALFLPVVDDYGD